MSADWVSALAAWLVYDRALVEQGEIWRLVTSHLVHFSVAHLGWNLLAIGGACVVAWQRDCRRTTTVALLAAAFGGLAIHFFAPSLSRYGGLSGIAAALVVHVALCGLVERGAWRVVSATTIALVVAKVGLELASGEFLLVGEGSGAGMVPAPLAHLGGIMAALVVWGQRHRIRVSMPSTMPVPVACSARVMTLFLALAVSGCVRGVHVHRAALPSAPLLERAARDTALEAAPLPSGTVAVFFANEVTPRSDGSMLFDYRHAGYPRRRVGPAREPGLAPLSSAERAVLIARMRERVLGDSSGRQLGWQLVAGLQPQGINAGAPELLDLMARDVAADVIVIVSYDQRIHTAEHPLILPAMLLTLPVMIPFARTEARTLVDASAFDVRTHRIIARAAGTSFRSRRGSILTLPAAVRRVQRDGLADALDAATVALVEELARR